MQPSWQNSIIVYRQAVLCNYGDTLYLAMVCSLQALVRFFSGKQDQNKKF